MLTSNPMGTKVNKKNVEQNGCGVQMCTVYAWGDSDVISSSTPGMAPTKGPIITVPRLAWCKTKDNNSSTTGYRHCIGGVVASEVVRGTAAIVRSTGSIGVVGIVVLSRGREVDRTLQHVTQYSHSCLHMHKTDVWLMAYFPGQPE